ncbi:MAG: NAD(P)H-dependent oxidoreductase [Promethearchaeota archaeon]
MKIIVLNGSPKGIESATMQYILYIQKKYPQHELKILNIAQQIKKIENDEVKFQEIIEDVKNSDGVIWGFPLYVMLVPSQYKRFIELITERNVEDAFKNKYTTVLTTSIHFFDITAINYLNGICDDLEMKYVGFYSADMYDLMRKENREKLFLFADSFFSAIENNAPTSRQNLPLVYHDFKYKPDLDLKDEEKINNENTKILLLTDSTDENTNLGKMIQRLRNCFSNEIKIINIYDIDIKGGCLGCIQCGYDNTCVYKEKDGFTEFWNSLNLFDVLIFAGTIQDRYLSSRWKLVLDRSFFNGHIPTLSEKQFGFVISGPLGQIFNLKQILQTFPELQGSNLVDIITDEYQDSGNIDSLLLNFAKNLVRFSKSGYIKPFTFLTVGGSKIFRDAIYGRMRFVFQADHKFYEEHGYYDFPQNDERAKQMNESFIPLTQDEEYRKKFYSMMKKFMIKPLKGIVTNPNK